MKFSTSYTPKNWEFGIGWYRGEFFIHAITERLTRHPSEFYIMLGPWTFSILIGHKVEVL